MRRRSRSPLLFIVILFVIIGALGFLAYQTFTHPSQVVQLVTGHKSEIAETNGRTNVLLLGIGGGTHDGPNLTDTIIFASIDRTSNAVSLISVPRDLWIINDNGQRGAKINSVYADGQDNNPPTGLTDASREIFQVTGQPIHYAFRIDFNGFVKAVDLLGGIDVNVERTLDDYVYPIEGKEDESCGHSPTEIDAWTNAPDTATKAAELEFFPCRYMHLHVDKGIQHMDGQTALRYVRSRHASGVEGTDFARSRRQQLVIQAIRTKVFSAGTLLDPTKITSLFGVLQQSIDTNIPQGAIPEWVDILRHMKDTPIKSSVIDFGNGENSGLLIQPPMTAQYGYASVLIPRTGVEDFSEIHAFVSCELTQLACPIGPTPFESPIPASPSAGIKKSQIRK